MNKQTRRIECEIQANEKELEWQNVILTDFFKHCAERTCES